jgi:histidinol-phosphatase
VASNGHLHEAALAFLGSVQDDDDPDTARFTRRSVSDLSSRRKSELSDDEPPLG